MLSFRGPLRDRSGIAITVPVELVFRLYDAPFGGSLVAGPFGPIQVSAVGGRYSTPFGPVPADQLDRGPRWLEVTVGGASLPRVKMEKVFYDWMDERGHLKGDRTLVSQLERLPSTGAERSLASSTTILNNGPPSNRIDLVYVGDGYRASDLGAYADHVQYGLTSLLSQEPFSSYRTFFNAYRVDVVSKESGVDNDPYGTTRDTALDMGFWCSGIERLLCVSIDKAYQYAAAAPAVDHVFAVANSSHYGGAGYTSSDLATFAGANALAPEIAVHETGHSLGKLADEYDGGGPVNYSGPEPLEPNISTLDAGSMAASGAKWARWLGDPGTGFGGVIYTYEGAAYSQRGIYRPTVDSKMRDLGQPFNLPSVESLILQMYKIVRPIDNATPSGTRLDEFSTVFVDPVDPPGHPLEVRWYLDGRMIPGETEDTLGLCAGSIPLGDHVLSVTVRDNTPWVRDDAQRAQWLTETRSWDLHVGGSIATPCGPLVTGPTTVSTQEGSPLSFIVQAMDPDGGPISALTASGTAFAAGASFTPDPSNTKGTFQWTPTYGQAGTYLAAFTATDESGATGSALTTVEVAHTNRAPIVVAPVTVSVHEGDPLTFQVTASDPDQDPLVSLTASGIPLGASFVPNATGTAGGFDWTPANGQAGAYTVTFAASDPSGSTASTETNVDVSSAGFEVRLASKSTAIQLESGQPEWCAQIEPVAGIFSAADVDLSSIAMKYDGRQAMALSDKTTIIVGEDPSGEAEVQACWSKPELGTLFSSLPSGRHALAVTIEGGVKTGGRFSGTLELDVVTQGNFLSASVSPNPSNPQATLTFVTSRPGFARVQLFDIIGHLVQTLLDASDLAAGIHQLPIDGLGRSGDRLPSGVYFYRVQVGEGTIAGRLTLAR